MTERLPFHFSLSCIGEGNGNPLQCSCLKNPGDGGAWWAAVCGVAQSRTRLKRLSSSSSSKLSITLTNTKEFLTLVTYLSQLGSFLKKSIDDLTTQQQKIKVEGKLTGLGRNPVIVIIIIFYIFPEI